MSGMCAVSQNSPCATNRKIQYNWALSAIVIKLYTPTNSVLRHPNGTFRKERVYSPGSVFIRGSLDIG